MPHEGDRLRDDLERAAHEYCLPSDLTTPTRQDGGAEAAPDHQGPVRHLRRRVLRVPILLSGYAHFSAHSANAFLHRDTDGMARLRLLAPDGDGS